jgi:hypothetical protein
MLSLSLVFALPGTMAAQGGKKSAQDVQGGKFTIGAPGDGVLMYNACNNNQSLVWAPGYTEVNYQVNGNNVSVHVLFHNNGSDTTSSSPYRLNLEANQTFNAVASSYEVPFHSVWSGDAGSFTMDGTLRFGPSDSAGKPFSNILWDANHPLNLACTQ